MEGCRDQRQEGAGQGGASNLYDASGIWRLAPLRLIPLHQNGGRTRNHRLISSECAPASANAHADPRTMLSRVGVPIISVHYI